MFEPDQASGGQLDEDQASGLIGWWIEWILNLLQRRMGGLLIVRSIRVILDYRIYS